MVKTHLTSCQFKHHECMTTLSDVVQQAVGCKLTTRLRHVTGGRQSNITTTSYSTCTRLLFQLCTINSSQLCQLSFASIQIKCISGLSNKSFKLSPTLACLPIKGHSLVHDHYLLTAASRFVTLGGQSRQQQVTRPLLPL